MKPEDAELVHQTSLKILEEVGVRLEHDGVAGRVIRAGARPGPNAQEVRFPREMVAECLALAPAEVELAAREGGASVLTAGSPAVFWTNPAMQVWTGSEVREATSRDLAAVARLCDSLPGVQGVMGMALSDVAPRHRDFTGVRIIAESCRRHVRALCFTPAGAEALSEMRKVFPGSWLSVGFTAHGPLRWTHLALDIFLRSAGSGIPATINGEPMAGVTGPVSLAGSVAVGNAEILAGIAVNQVLEPGRPLIYNLGLAHTFDMKAATAVTGGPENALFAEASAAMGRFYNIPSASWVSTESVFDDAQASLEKTFGIQAHIGSGVSLIWGLGQLESEKTISLAQLVIDSEAVAYARRCARGFEVSAETLQYELIRETGIGGSYLETGHTLENFREHLWEPAILNRRPRELCAGRLDEVARRRAEEMLAADTGAKIGREELRELKRIEAAYRKKIE